MSESICTTHGSPPSVGSARTRIEPWKLEEAIVVLLNVGTMGPPENSVTPLNTFTKGMKPGDEPTMMSGVGPPRMSPTARVKPPGTLAELKA